MRPTRPRLVHVALLAAVTVSGSCHGGGHRANPVGAASATASEPDGSNAVAAGAAVRAAWGVEFGAATPLATRQDRLQNGALHAADLREEADLARQDGTSIRVSGVQFDTPAHAVVTFDLLLSGQPVVTGAKGEAEYLGRRWKVAETTHCTLLALQGLNPPACAEVPEVGPGQPGPP
jgi:hypothetical protein